MHWASALRPSRLSLAALSFSLAVAPAFAADQGLDRGMHGVLELETGSADGISGQIASDIATLLNDGATRRGAKLIWFEATAVREDGRGRPWSDRRNDVKWKREGDAQGTRAGFRF